MKYLIICYIIVCSFLDCEAQINKKIKNLVSKGSAERIEFNSKVSNEKEAVGFQIDHGKPIILVNNFIYTVPNSCLCDRSIGGDKDGRSMAGDKDERSMAGDKDGRSIGGDKDGRSMAGDKDGRSIGGDKDGRSIGGDKDGRSIGGDKDGRLTGGDKLKISCWVDNNCIMKLNNDRSEIKIFFIDDYGIRAIENNEIELR